ncbi:type II toxin-antitoxin system RelE/ParE family toxin [Acidisoma silvae]|uniref:type II toxin-antitoxin system RelE/ParE family toxin n=1 Tax=Acidisoma silvae TaxID=2802396 RepID=UPI003872EA60
MASEASEVIATDFVREIGKAFERLRYFPLAGPERPQLAASLRVGFYASYAFYYRPLADTVVIIRVLHGARDAAALAERGGFA